MSADELESWIVAQIQQQAGLAPGDLDPDAVLAEVGLSSRDALVLIGDLQRHLGRELSPTLFWEYPTARALARYLTGASPISGAASELTTEAADGGTGEPIAIIGLGCRFAGADDPDEFWKLLEEGRTAVGRGGKPGLLRDVEGFDAEFFAISAREAAHVDPQHRLLMEVAWETMERAGVAPTSLAGTRTGVFVGISASDYGRIQAGQSVPLGPHSATGQALSVAANRLSYFLDLRGPSMAVDTACSSSLVAVHLACRSLRAGESTVALAGGVNLVLAPDATEIFTQAGMMAADGRCKTFDASADGYLRAEGCGLVLLKPLSAALHAGDEVLAVIRGSAVNQDGRSNGLTAPNGLAQRAVLRDALHAAGVSPADVDYVEAHGTGTPLGDPIEVDALVDVLGPRDEPLLLGSVKTNIGHAEAAAGIAGLIKVVLMLRHRQVPPHLHLQERNPAIAADAPIAIPDRITEWTRRGDLLTAGVSGFGFGGTNAHLIVQESTHRVLPEEPLPKQVLALSARTESALAALAGRYAAHLRSNPELSLPDFCHTVTTGRSQLKRRAAFAVGDRDRALKQLDDLASAAAIPTTGKKGKLAFLFSGQGSQYLDMGRQLYQTSPLYHDVLQECSKLLEPRLGRTLISILFAQPDDAPVLDQTRFTQPALFAVEYALAQLWQSWGVRPDLLLGHSVGELAAACVAGVFDLADGLRLAAERGRLVQELVKPGAMLVVFAGEATVREAAAGYGLTVAAVNGTENVTVSGAQDGLAALRRDLTEQGVATHPVKAGYAFHSPMMVEAAEAFGAMAQSIAYREPAVRLVSDLDGRIFDADNRPDAAYWQRHLQQCVRYADGVQVLADEGCVSFVEVGPQQVLLGAGRRIVGGEGLWVPSLRKDVPAWDVLTGSLAQLYTAGYPIDWAGVYKGHRRPRRAVPTYPFERRRHWILEAREGTPEEAPQGRPEAAGQAVRTVGTGDWLLADVGEVVGALLAVDAPIDPDTSFLDLGADSMTLFQTLQAIQKAFDVSIPVGRLFEELNTVRRVADYIRQTASPAVLARHEPAAVPAPASGKLPGAVAADDEPPSNVNKFLEVHAQVMNQAYELMRGTHAGRSITGPTANTAEKLAAEPAVRLTPKDTYVPFTAGQAAKSSLGPVQREFAAELVRRYCAHTPGSKRHAIAERPVHADVRHAPQPYRHLTQARYPIVVDRAEGARVWDVDGHEYIDLTMGFGVNLFGHGEPLITQALTDRLGRGMQVGPQSAVAGEVAQLIHELTGQQRVLFCNTGSEAVMVAVRLARAVTGRDKIALFAGAYHGAADPVLARQDAAGGGRSVPMAPGILPDVAGNALVLPYADPSSLDVIRHRASELAAVLVEPVQSRRPDLQPVEFLRSLRELTRQAEVPLIFDEVITGFRMHPGGVQALWDIQADLTTYGKVIGGGLPIGVVAGQARFLDAIDGGSWVFDDMPPTHSVRTFYTGTFCKHPLAMAAGRAVLGELRRRGPALQADLNDKVATLARRLNQHFTAAGVPIEVVHFGSLFRLRFPGEPTLSETVELLYLLLAERGLYIWEGRNCFLSTAHTDADIERIFAAVSGAVDEMVAAGFFLGGSTLVYPLSNVQREIWYLDQTSPQLSSAYNESLVLELTGRLELTALRSAVADVVARHDSLRTVFTPDGSKQVVQPSVPVAVPIVESTDELPEHVFNLSTGPLFKAFVRRLGAEHHQLHLIVHHSVIDGWSFAILVGEILDRYAGRPLADSPTYREYVARQAEQMASPAGEQDTAYWVGQFVDGFPTLALPTDHPRRPGSPRRGGLVELTVEQSIVEQLTVHSGQLGVTAFSFLFAAYTYLMHRLTGQDDLVVGVPVARRDYPGAEQLVGHCSNLLPIRSRWRAGTSMPDHVRAVHRTLIDAYEHPDFAMAAVRSGVRMGGGSQDEIFGSIFNMDLANEVPQPDGLAVRVLRMPPGHAKTSLMVDVLSVGNTLTLNFEYDADLFTESTIGHYARMYAHLLGELTLEPDDDRADLVATAQGARAPFAGSVIDLFEAQAARTPDAIAVVSGQDRRTLTYRELDQRAASLAGLLYQQGVRPETPVGVHLPRSTVDLITAVVAVWKAGGALVALDVDLPIARRDAIVADAGIAHIISEVPEDLPDVGRPAPTRDAVLPQSLSYVIYTSGSTGRPKGVMATNHGLLALATGWDRAYRISGRIQSVLQMANVGFDVFVGDIVRALCHGARLVLCPRDLLLLPDKLYQLICDERVDLAEFVPLVATTLADHLRATGQRLDHMKVLVVGSDTIRHAELADLRRLVGPDAEVVNSYGLTEATIDSTYQVFDETDQDGLIGVPYPNCEAYIFDDDLRLVPVGVVGMLYLGGDGVTRGYLNQPDATAATYPPHPLSAQPGARLFRTGDLARYRRTPRGLAIEYLGRQDSQLKIRGYRVELGEVESALRQVTGHSAVAAVLHDGTGLVGYVAGAAEAPIGQWHDQLRQRLPQYMVPAGFVLLDTLPTTPSGKVNHAALRARSTAEVQVPSRPYVPPRTPLERQLAEVWAEVLGRGRVGVDEDFFALGGDSLSATRLVSRIRSVLGVELSIRALFDTPTVASVATAWPGAGATRPALVAQPRPRIVPLSSAQQRLWFLNRFQKQSEAYHIAMSLRLTGEIDRQALRAAFLDVITRHESLRTVVAEVDGVAAQRILPVDQCDFDFDSPEAVTRPFDLTADLPLRVALSEHDTVLTLVLHHIAGDAWSIAPLAADMATAYAARLVDASPSWSPLPVQYADYTLWQRQVLGSEDDPDSVISRQLAYWTEALAGLPEELDLPYDRPRPAVASHRGQLITFVLDAEVHGRMSDLATRCRASVFMVAQAALAALLTRLGAGTDIPIGGPIAGRTDEALGELVGFFVNTLVLRTDTSGDPAFQDLVARVRDVNLSAYANQDVPFERLVRALNPARSLARHPLFQVALVSDDTQQVTVDLVGLKLREEPTVAAAAKFDVSVVLRERPEGGVDCELEYSTDLFDHATAQLIVDRFVSLLSAAVKDPGLSLGRLPLLSTEEHAQITADTADRFVKVLEEESDVH